MSEKYMPVMESVIYCNARVHYHLSRIALAQKNGSVMFLTLPVSWFRSHNHDLNPQWCRQFFTLLCRLGGRRVRFQNFNYEDRHPIWMVFFDGVGVDIAMLEKIRDKFNLDGSGDMETMKLLNGEGGLDGADFSWEN